jgi:hypothetical protein
MDADVAQSTEVIEVGHRREATRLPRRAVALVAASLAIAVGGVSYVAAGAGAPAAGALTVAYVHRPAEPAAVVTGGPAAMAAGVASRLFSSAPVVVVAATRASAATLTAAAQDARRAFAPMLLASAIRHWARWLVGGAIRTEIDPLHPQYVLAVGLPAQALAAQLPGVEVVTRASALPATAAPAPLRRVALLVRAGNHNAATTAAVATARAAGVQVIATKYNDPRGSRASVTQFAASKPREVLALGAGFGAAKSLAAKVVVAETGVQLPGGGQLLFPGHRLICLYGSPGTPALGALGEQGLTASIARIRSLAAMYRKLSRVPVVPAFEILATVAQGSPGRNGMYSYENSVAALRPWVRKATRQGLYVILDLQPGRADLLAQAKRYRSLLKLPDVGLAIDPEWKLQPGQLPLQQIGGVSITEVNRVIKWLGALTARNHLPQKLLVLHQFELSMIRGEARLDTRQSDLAIVIHMDGQGAPSVKQQTWNAVIAAAPHGVFFGWKNFLVKDHPMLDPQETMRHWPRPVMISYE